MINALPEKTEEELAEERMEETVPAAYVAEPVHATDGSPLDLVQNLAVRVDSLVQKLTAATDSAECRHEIVELQKLAKEMGQERFVDSLQQHISNPTGSQQAAVIVPTGGQPLKMWESSFWVKQFPDLFPYGDGAYGISRRRNMSLQQWGTLMLPRTELEYMPAEGD